MEKSKEELTIPKSIVFPKSRNHFISLMSETWEYELFTSINFQQREIHKEGSIRFEGESSEISRRRLRFP